MPMRLVNVFVSLIISLYAFSFVRTCVCTLVCFLRKRSVNVALGYYEIDKCYSNN